MNSQNRKKSLGIGLLELMLSLAIIAVLLIMATRYYSSASNSQKITAATGMINAVKAAAASYLGGNATAYASNVSIANLVSAGYLPSSFVAGSNGNSSTTNPWNESVGVTATASTITITMATPSSDICGQLQQQVQSSSTGSAAGATIKCGLLGNASTLTAKFPVGG